MEDQAAANESNDGAAAGGTAINNPSAINNNNNDNDGMMIAKTATNAPSSSSSHHQPQQRTRRASNSNAPSSVIVPPNNNNTTNSSSSTTISSIAPPRVIARPPLNPYLKIAIIRNTTDTITCNDTINVGKRKSIGIHQLLMPSSLSSLEHHDDEKKIKVGQTDDSYKNKSLEGDSNNSNASAAVKKEHTNNNDTNNKESTNNPNNNKSKNKKEIPVPTITTVSTYNIDIPSTYYIPLSYVRHVPPTYEEIMKSNCNIEYNLDENDEIWLYENKDFGPYSEAKIIIEGEEGEKCGYEGGDEKEGGKVQDCGNDGNKVIADKYSVVASSTATKEGGKKMKMNNNNNKKASQRNKKGKFVKKSFSKKQLLMSVKDEDASSSIKKEEDEDPMDIDESKSNSSDMSRAVTTTAVASNNNAATQSQQYKNLTIKDVLLLNPKYIHSKYSTSHLLRKYNPKLPLYILERMIDTFEKATNYYVPISLDNAKQLLIKEIPQLVNIFGPLSERERKLMKEEDERYLVRWFRLNNMNDDGTPIMEDGVVQVKDEKKQEQSKQTSSSPLPLPTLAPPITLPEVIKQVYNYWITKRSKHPKKGSLLRRYQTPTLSSDVNPQHVFRQRTEKEKRRLRKKKQNDVEAYNKMKLLRVDFERLKVLCDLLTKREEVNGTMIELSNDYFEQRLRGFIDTSGGGHDNNMMTRSQQQRQQQQQSQSISREMIESVLNGIPKYFDDGPIVRVKGNKKRKRAQQQQQLGGWNTVDSRDTSPIPASYTNAANLHMSNQQQHQQHNMANLGHLGMTQPLAHPPPPLSQGIPPTNNKKYVVAGHDLGIPAPNFLQPLASRTTHNVTSEHKETVPSIPSYVNGRSTFHPHKFKHRPRLGRGGRIIIDRVPLPSSSALSIGPGRVSPPTVITYGTPMPRCGYHTSTLGADNPNYSINCSPDKLCNPSKLDVEGTNAMTAPRVPAAQSLVDLLPKPLLEDEDGTTTSVLKKQRRIEKICAMGLLEDYNNIKRKQQKQQGNTTSSSAVTAGSASATSSKLADNDVVDDDDEVLVPIADWMEAPESMKLYGTEKWVIGPL